MSMNALFGVMFVVGILFSIYALSEAPKTKDCSIAAQNAMRGILVMGVAMTCISFTALMCKCGSSDSSHGLGGVFLIGMICFSVTTLVLISIIMGQCKDASNGVTTTMLILAIIAVLVSGGYGGYLLYEDHQGKDGGGAAKALGFRFYNY
tara:strand:- start:3025 stop:3474 length:450 start_codon:yes stop_codon:yes gene_type:complete